VSELRPNHHETRIAASLDEVWNLLTTAEGLASWFGAEASIELVVGGERVVGWGPDMLIEGTIDLIEPLHRLRIIYLHDGEQVGAEEWILSSEAGSTTVRLIHSLPDPGVEDWDGYYGDYERGWAIFLTSMKHALETALHPSRRLSYDFAPVPDDRANAFSRLQAAVETFGAHGMAPVIWDPPNTIMLAGPHRTLVCDLEGAEPELFAYLQLADHGDADSSEWRQETKRLLIDAVSGGQPADGE
jgi:uncharacterized protein YndB with AHSA1/START domain